MKGWLPFTSNKAPSTGLSSTVTTGESTSLPSGSTIPPVNPSIPSNSVSSFSDHNPATDNVSAWSRPMKSVFGIIDHMNPWKKDTLESEFVGNTHKYNAYLALVKDEICRFLGVNPSISDKELFLKLRKKDFKG